QHQAEDVVTVASRFKQRYECRLPPAAVGPPPGPPRDPRLYNGSGVAELLRPMGTAPCLLKTKDWWTYEFCYGRHIQQYHLEESEIKGDILVLGYYQSAFDWDDETAKASKQHQLRRYHSQSYVNGSRCDLTGRAREAEVRVRSGDTAGQGDMAGCGDMAGYGGHCRGWPCPLQLKTAVVPRSVELGLSPHSLSLSLSPVSPADTKRKVEEISEELRTLDTRLWSDRDSEPPSQSPGATQQGMALSQLMVTAQPVSPLLLGPLAWLWARSSQCQACPPCGSYPRKKIHFKVIRSPGDLLQFIEELKEGTRK
ncbi:OS9 protein, partial [Copsychus sechellarum]|nr:OS9 protein [Copsychus sechellarum]